MALPPTCITQSGRIVRPPSRFSDFEFKSVVAHQPSDEPLIRPAALAKIAALKVKVNKLVERRMEKLDAPVEEPVQLLSVSDEHERLIRDRDDAVARLAALKVKLDKLIELTMDEPVEEPVEEPPQHTQELDEPAEEPEPPQVVQPTVVPRNLWWTPPQRRARPEELEMVQPTIVPHNHWWEFCAETEFDADTKLSADPSWKDFVVEFLRKAKYLHQSNMESFGPKSRDYVRRNPNWDRHGEMLNRRRDYRKERKLLRMLYGQQFDGVVDGELDLLVSRMERRQRDEMRRLREYKRANPDEWHLREELSEESTTPDDDSDYEHADRCPTLIERRRRLRALRERARARADQTLAVLEIDSSDFE